MQIGRRQAGRPLDRSVVFRYLMLEGDGVFEVFCVLVLVDARHAGAAFQGGEEGAATLRGWKRKHFFGILKDAVIGEF